MTTKLTSEEVRIAEMAVSLARQNISARLESCTYCDQGVNAYTQAQHAISEGFSDTFKTLDRIRREIAKGGS